MREEFHHHTLPNGLVLLGEPIPSVRSAAVAFELPLGAAVQPPELSGTAAITAEWLLRGAGDRDSRALNDALDALGAQHDASATPEHLSLTTVQLGRNLSDVLDLYADIVLRPRLEETTFDPCRQLILQDLESLEDAPDRKSLALLREKFFPWPLGRLIYGDRGSLESMAATAAADHVRDALKPQGAIVSVAGNFDWTEVREQIERLFGGWDGPPPPRVVPGSATGGVNHIEKDSAQTHIALGCPAPPIRDEHYYAARVAQAVLSRGMSSRLFTEVREKRGLAYAVMAAYRALRDHAGLLAYVGTRPELAQKSLEVTVGEIRRLGQDITDEELARAVTQFRSDMIMQGQSTLARAKRLAGDWYHLGRLRSLDEINQAIRAVTRDDIAAYLEAYPAEEFTIQTIGPNELTYPTRGGQA